VLGSDKGSNVGLLLVSLHQKRRGCSYLEREQKTALTIDRSNCKGRGIQERQEVEADKRRSVLVRHKTLNPNDKGNRGIEGVKGG